MNAGWPVPAQGDMVELWGSEGIGFRVLLQERRPAESEGYVWQALITDTAVYRACAVDKEPLANGATLYKVLMRKSATSI